MDRAEGSTGPIGGDHVQQALDSARQEMAEQLAGPYPERYEQ